MNWYLKALKNYVGFKGRARRREFWMFVLIHAIIILVLMLIDSLLGPRNPGMPLGFLTCAYLLVTLVPSIALLCRRLHDIDKSGWMQLIGAIPLIGEIVLIVWCAKPGRDGNSSFGPDPMDE